MKLFDEYTYIPFIKSKNYIDNILPSNEYEKIYFDFEKCIVSINKKIDKLFFKNKFNYASKYFVIIEPHFIAFNLFTKAIILDRILVKKKLNEIIIEVFEEEISDNYNHRFINQYFLLAKKIGIPFKTSNKGKLNIKYKLDTSTQLKFLTLLNFNYKVLFYEIKKRIIGNFNKKKILNIGDNYLVREIEFELHKKGIDFLPVKKELKIFYDELSVENNNKDKYKFICKIVKTEMNNLIVKYINNKKVGDGFVKVISDIIFYNINDLLSKKDLMRKKISKYKEKLNFNLCLGNGLFGNFGKSVYDALSYNKIQTVTTEHGLTAGNSRDALQSFYLDESLTSDRLFCYSEASVKTRLKNNNSNLKLDVVGAPEFPKNIRFKKLKRCILKRKFKLKGINVFYISHNIELNPGKYFPYSKSNPELFSDELSILKTLSKINKNVIYKPYPTMQYLYDRSKIIKNSIKKYNNITFFKGEEDFRYVRAIADIIITQSSESTLEWCIGSNVPLIFLDSDYYEPLENHKVKKAFEESFFLFNYDRLNWEKEMIDFLNLPYEEILKRWKEKEIFRKKYDNKYFLSSKKYAGGIGSKLLFELINEDNN
ncbi:MAG: hypothetical protein ACJ0P1_07035 [Flavobacteriaceae bacterium]